MPNGIYVFGGKEMSEVTSLAGLDCLRSTEYLANGTLEWQKGPEVPIEAEFMDGGYGVAISETELVLMGGYVTIRKEYHENEPIYKYSIHGYQSDQIWKFNTITEEWQLIGNLKIARSNHRAVYLNGKIIVSGGVEETTTEIFDPHHVNVEPILVGNFNVPRYIHGMGTILKNGIRKVIAFGGFGGRKNPQILDSIEEWDPEKREWTLLKQKLSKGRLV